MPIDKRRSHGSARLNSGIGGHGRPGDPPILRRGTASFGDGTSAISSYHMSNAAAISSNTWHPGQEYSRISMYDPIHDIIHAHEYITSRKPLKFRQVFRYATWLDWILMVLGILLAMASSVITPWLYYWAGVTIHDVLIYERCNTSRHQEGTKYVCDIPYFCETQLASVGNRLFMNILYGWVAYNVLQLGYCLFFTVAADHQTKAMRAAYFESIVRKDMVWYDINADKDFAKDMNDQIIQIRLGIGEVIPNFVNLFFTIISLLVIVFYLNHWVALTFLSFVPLSMGVLYLGNWAEKKRSQLADKMFQKASIVTRDSLVNIKVIKMYEGEEKQAKLFAQALDDTTKKTSYSRQEVGWMAAAAFCSASIWFILNVATGLVFWIGQNFQNSEDFCKIQRTWGLISQHGFTSIMEEGIEDLTDSPGEILVVYFGLMYLTLHFMELPKFISLMKLAKQNATDVFFIVDWKSRIDNTSNEGKAPKRSAVGRIDFFNVTFRYPQKPEVCVLNIRQLTIFSGQYVAFAGPADSGKNTLLKLIPRLYDCCSGFIALDAVNLQNYNIHWLRRQMCVISEAPVIFSGTISENILIGKLNASEDEIIKACQMAEVHHIIEKLPNGYNTVINGKDFGDHLTRNQKRQLCLARAYLHRSRLILMDNPVQPEGDYLEPLLLNFVNHFRDTATVILASTNVTALSKRADCIYYMENGRIIESGNHIQLIQARGKYYSRLEGTVNCSLESRNKFESQLKAYKYSQMLQKKRNSQGSDRSVGNVLDSLEQSYREKEGSGGSKKGDWKNMFMAKKQTTGSREELDVEKGNVNVEKGNVEKAKDPAQDSEGEESTHEEERERHRDTKRVSSPTHLIETKTMEETYCKFIDNKRRTVTGGGYMHQGFGMMGFQRLNFARPMTNYSTQINKTAHSAKPSFSLKKKSLNTALSSQLNLRGSITPSDSSDATLTSSRVHFAPSSISTVKSSTAKFLKGIINKRGKNKGKKTAVQAKTMSSISKSLHKQKQRESIQGFLQTLTTPNALQLNENVELDTVSIESNELDSFLAEYDESVHTTLRSEVKGFWRDIFFVSQHYWPYIIPGLVASVLLGISIPYQTWIAGTFIETLGNDAHNLKDSNAKTEEEKLREEVMSLTMYMLVTGGIAACAAFVQEFCFGMAGRKMTRRLRKTLFRHILNQDISWFDEKDHDIGIITLQLYADTVVVHHILLMFYGIILQTIFNVVSSIALAAVETSWGYYKITLGFIGAMPIIISVVYISTRKELHQAEILEESYRAAGGFAQEFLANMKTWFSLGAEGFFIARYRTLLNKEYGWIRISGILMTCLHGAVQTSSWLIYGIFILVVLMDHDHIEHSGHDVRRGTIEKWPTPWSTPTLVGYLVITAELLIFGAYRVGDQITILADVDFGKTAAHKIMRILMTKPETEDPEEKYIIDQLMDEDIYQPPPEIGLTDVTYFYPGTEHSVAEGHLQEISMTIPSNSYVAIVGPPGSGKSTLCNIILRMCNPTHGVLDFNGDDCRKLCSPKLARRQMGLVEYDPCLFDYTILENIQFGKGGGEEPSKQDVEEASKLSNCHYEILDLPEDYETRVDHLEHSAQNFSLKQRIAFARSVVRNPKVLVIDDATSSVDMDSDHKIMQVISNVREGRTLIVFSHRIEPIRDADNIYVLWEGELVEHGTDSFLLQKKGYYFEMYMTQKVLADSMRNSPQQLCTIKYNIKKTTKCSLAMDSDLEISNKQNLADIAAQNPEVVRKSSMAFVKFLDEKVDRMKAQKEQRRNELESELPELEKEEKEREIARLEKKN